MTILVNNDIPSTMTQAGLIYLGKMAKTVPKNGVIVEIGPLFGSSTWVLAKNAHPSVEVISIDTWEPAPWIDKLEKKVEGCLPFSIETFKKYVADCPNVTPIQGWSPDIVSDWDRPIDMFFDDASHGNPGFINNLDFFVPMVKRDGIVCGDDYAGGWPDIVREVDHLAGNWSTSPEIIGRVWSMVKPDAGNVNTVYSKIANPEELAIKIDVVTKSGLIYNASPSTWAGGLHKPDPIDSIKINLVNNKDDLDLKWKLALSEDKETDWMQSGDQYTLEGSDLIKGFSASLEGKCRKQYQLEYQLGFCMANGGIKRLSNSKAERASRMLVSSVDDDAAVNAVLLHVSKRK